jgi:hypothetical protein
MNVYGADGDPEQIDIDCRKSRGARNLANRSTTT